MSSIPIYCMFLLVISRRVSLRLEKIQRDFLWRGGAFDKKSHLVNWSFGQVGQGNGLSLVSFKNKGSVSPRVLLITF